MSYIYQTLADGTVQTQGGDGSWTTPWPSAAEIGLFEKQTAQWRGLVESAAAKYGLPPELVYGILAIIYGESGGNASSGPSFDNGVGLMAITHSSLKAKPGGGFYTADELKNPELNIDIGVGKMIAPEFKIMGLDLPQIASGFNGGYGSGGAHHSSQAPWGWREYKIPSTGAFPYISKVVRINNYAVQSLSGTSTVPPSGAPPADDAGSDTESSSPLLIALGIGIAIFVGARLAR
jgi:hypothetical protein